MDIGKIGDLLKRYEKIIGIHTDSTKKIINTIEQVSKITLTKEQVVFNKGKLKITVSAVEKQQLFMYKSRILAELKSQGIAVFELS